MSTTGVTKEYAHGVNQKTIYWDGAGKLGAFVRFFPLHLLSASLVAALPAWLAKLEYFLQ